MDSEEVSRVEVEAPKAGGKTLDKKGVVQWDYWPIGYLLSLATRVLMLISASR